MPDITMCNNKECPKKEVCYRYMAKPSEYRQAYATFDWTKDDCFLPLYEDEKKTNA